MPDSAAQRHILLGECAPFEQQPVERSEMPPNSTRSDRFDKLERPHRSANRQARSDLQVKKSCKFRSNFASGETKNCKCNRLKQSTDELGSRGAQSAGPNSCSKGCPKSSTPTNRSGTSSRQRGEPLKPTNSSGERNCKLNGLRSSPTVDVHSNELKQLKPKFTNTCSSCRTLCRHSRTITCYALLAVACLLIYLPCIHNEFVFDDIPAILHNEVVQQPTPFTNLAQLFTTDYWGAPIRKVSSLWPETSHVN